MSHHHSDAGQSEYLSHCHHYLTDTKMRRDLHSDDVLNVKVFQRCGVGVLSFVVLDNYLLYDSV